MEYWIGLGLAAAVCLYARVVGLDRGRVFYATLTAVVGTYYVLFAAMAGSTDALIWESLIAVAFFAAAAAGFRKSRWLIAAALAGHGVFDLVHYLVIQNPGVPAWWPGFCSSFDVLAGGVFALSILSGTSDQHQASL